MLPGKKYTLDDFAKIAWRRKWLILIPFVLVSVGTATVAHFLPNKYRSETLILVVPQRVPESYVRSTVTTRIEDRLQSMREEILSRTRLERIIVDNNLYAEERRTGIMQDVVEQMRKDIDVVVIKGDAFRVSYVGRDPMTVMKTTERLASLFIEENLQDRESLAEGTNQFLEATLQNARQSLVEQEQKLEAFRKKYAGELPSQATSNLQFAQNAQMQIQAILESLNRDRDRRLTVQGHIADLSLPENQVVATTPGSGADGPGVTARDQLAFNQAQLRIAESRLTPEHPDIKRLQRRIADLQERAQAEALASPLSPEAAPILTPAQLAKRARLKDLQLELESLDRQIATKQTQEQELRKTADEYQARVQMVPARETELAELTRDYNTMQQIYGDLLAKNQESKVAANLERRQIGEQFKTLDPARLPEKPFSPDRLRINLAGILFGLVLGVAITGAVELRDSSFRTEDDVVTVLALPVLARIPMMVTELDLSRRHRRRLVMSTAGVTAFLGAGALVWKLGVLNSLFR
ncbi:MAG TPA: GNVR domain-containing protein [Vicinamibacterales bacterium]|nr:GNVR domain-containing protein [Vicinamibacterales bacterium]